MTVVMNEKKFQILDELKDGPMPNFFEKFPVRTPDGDTTENYADIVQLELGGYLEISVDGTARITDKGRALAEYPGQASNEQIQTES